MSLLAGIILRVFAVVGLCLACASAWTMVEANQATLSITSRKDEGTLVEIVPRLSPDQPLTAPAA